MTLTRDVLFEAAAYIAPVECEPCDPEWRASDQFYMCRAVALAQDTYSPCMQFENALREHGVSCSGNLAYFRANDRWAVPFGGVTDPDVNITREKQEVRFMFLILLAYSGVF